LPGDKRVGSASPYIVPFPVFFLKDIFLPYMLRFSFSEVGTFVPLSTDPHGQVIREVAPARITLPHEDHPDAPLDLQVALIRDLRRLVPVQPDPEETEIPPRWDSDLPLDERTWWPHCATNN
jgi:hypothetical protein